MKKFKLIIYITFLILFFNLININNSYTKSEESKIDISYTTVSFKVCPPSIFGYAACEYPSIFDLIKRVIDFIVFDLAPPVMVIILIFGGFMYLLAPINVEEFIKRGHNYIKYAIYGYILLLLIDLIFTTISSILGGP